jgi:hypothetical protein
MNDYLSITKLATALGLRLKETRDRLLEAGLLQKGTNGFVPTERAQKYQPKLGRWRISLGPDVWDWNVAEVRKLIFVLEIDASTSQDASGVEAQDGKEHFAKKGFRSPQDAPDPMVLRFPRGNVRNTMVPVRRRSEPVARRDQGTPWDDPYVPMFDPSLLPKGPERDFLFLLAQSRLTLRDVTKLWNTLYIQALGCTAASFRRIHPEFVQGHALWKQIGGEIAVWFLLVMEWIVQQHKLQDGRRLQELFEEASAILDVPRQDVG